MPPWWSTWTDPPGQAARLRRRPRLRPYLDGVGEARTLWEEGHEPGRQMVALGLALTLTVVVLDVGIGGRVGLFFDLAFVAVCLALAMLVRPEDFFTVGVLPPLIMLAAFVLVGVSHRVAIAPDGDGLVQAVVTGLSQHAVALGVGYAACLLCLAIRDQFTRAGRLL
jgi:hypothetical protein